MLDIATSWWSLALPDEWEHETDEDTVIISDPDGVSTLELSVIELQGPTQDEAELRALAEEIVPAGAEACPVRCGPWQGLLYEYRDEDYCRDWILQRHSTVLLVGYTCAWPHARMDDAVIDEILAGLQPPISPDA